MHAQLHLSAISRSQGRSTVAASAYRSGGKVAQRSVVAAAAYRASEKLHDEKEDKTFDYSRKQNVQASGILVPENAPEWASDRQTYWNAVDREKRKDALLAKEALLVLPRNLDAEKQKWVVEEWSKENLVSKGLVVDYAIHSPDASDGGKNPHAHVLYYPRPFTEEGEFSKYKLTGYNTENTVDGKAFLAEARFSYEQHLNQASTTNDNEQGKDIQFDLRSYKERGIDKIPQPKKGQKVTAMEKQGYDLERVNEVRKVEHQNSVNSMWESHKKSSSKLYKGSKKDILHQMHQQTHSTYEDFFYGEGTGLDHEWEKGWGH